MLSLPVILLSNILSRFQPAGLHFKREKCFLGILKVEFLGFLANADGIHTSPNKVKKAIMNVVLPTSK